MGKEKPETEGRKAEDKSLHKGDWGSHASADKAEKAKLPTKEQLQHAQDVIRRTWIPPKVTP
jgi:hypothetical protein